MIYIFSLRAALNLKTSEKSPETEILVSPLKLSDRKEKYLQHARKKHEKSPGTKQALC